MPGHPQVSISRAEREWQGEGQRFPNARAAILKLVSAGQRVSGQGGGHTFPNARAAILRLVSAGQGVREQGVSQRLPP
ncbi:hypothetical protein D3C79_452050 [compost metagenome]